MFVVSINNDLTSGVTETVTPPRHGIGAYAPYELAINQFMPKNNEAPTRIPFMGVVNSLALRISGAHTSELL